MVAASPEPRKETIEAKTTLTVADVTMTFDGPALDADERQQSVEQFRDIFIKPALTRAQIELTQELHDQVIVSVTKVTGGSIEVAMILQVIIEIAQDPFVTTVAAGTLTGILTKKVLTDKKNDKEQYELVMDRVQIILKKHASELAGSDFDVTYRKYEIFNPKLKRYGLTEFTFVSRNVDELQSEIKDAIDRYHNNIGKP